MQISIHTYLKLKSQQGIVIRFPRFVLRPIAETTVIIFFSPGDAVCRQYIKTQTEDVEQILQGRDEESNCPSITATAQDSEEFRENTCRSLQILQPATTESLACIFFYC